MPVCFLDLPLELLPVILSHLQKPYHLSSTCLVSKTFHQFAATKLYERASIYSWQKEGKAKVKYISPANATECRK